MRARWYDPSVGRFVSRDLFPGVVSSVSSQNGFVFGWGDPVGSVDLSGLVPVSSAYQARMVSDGGINEVYDFYVGATLQNARSQASSAFYGVLQSAQAVDYTSLAAVEGIAGVAWHDNGRT